MALWDLEEADYKYLMWRPSGKYSTKATVITFCILLTCNVVPQGVVVRIMGVDEGHKVSRWVRLHDVGGGEGWQDGRVGGGVWYVCHTHQDPRGGAELWLSVVLGLHLWAAITVTKDGSR